MLLNFNFNADSDPASHSNANADPEPDPASKNNAFSKLSPLVLGLVLYFSYFRGTRKPDSPSCLGTIHLFPTTN